MKKIKKFIVVFGVIFVIFSGMGRGAGFADVVGVVCVASVVDETLSDIGANDASVTDTSVTDVSINSDDKSGRIYIEKSFADNDSLKISVYAKDVFSPVLGVSFHLKYDYSKISFVKYEPGDFLELGGIPFYLVKDSPKKNKIYFGETLKKGDTFPTEGGKIADFYFKILDTTATGDSADNASFSFANGNISTLDNGVNAIKNVSFENIDVNLNDRKSFLAGLSSVFADFNLSDGGFLFNIISVASICGAIILSLFLAFKHGKKRAESSVNFK